MNLQKNKKKEKNLYIENLVYVIIVGIQGIVLCTQA